MSAARDAAAMDPVDGAILDEQLRYYRARAPEYDHWFNREGRYDRGRQHSEAWRDELAMVRRVLDSVSLDGRRVLELASGTGIWTKELLDRGAIVTAVDAAPEMIEILESRLACPRLYVECANLFEFSPTARYAAVVSCFFMSHVPDERFGGFCEVITGALDEDGAVMLVDSLREPTSTAVDHALPIGRSQTMRRLLDDGSAFEIVKRFRGDEELEAVCASHGLAVRVSRTPTYFQIAIGGRAAVS